MAGMTNRGRRGVGGRPHRGDRTLYQSRIPTPLAQHLDERCDELGITRTEVVARLLIYATEHADVKDLPKVYEANKPDTDNEELSLTG